MLQQLYKQTLMILVLYSLNILRKIFADFMVLGVTSENFIHEIFRPPYSLIHCGSVCKSVKILFLAKLLNLEKFALRLYGNISGAVMQAKSGEVFGNESYMVEFDTAYNRHGYRS